VHQQTCDDFVRGFLAVLIPSRFFSYSQLYPFAGFCRRRGGRQLFVLFCCHRGTGPFCHAALGPAPWAVKIFLSLRFYGSLQLSWAEEKTGARSDFATSHFSLFFVRLPYSLPRRLL